MLQLILKMKQNKLVDFLYLRNPNQQPVTYPEETVVVSAAS